MYIVGTYAMEEGYDLGLGCYTLEDLYTLDLRIWLTDTVVPILCIYGFFYADQDIPYLLCSGHRVFDILSDLCTIDFGM